MDDEAMTVGEAVRRLRDDLRAAGVAEPGPKAEWTVAHILGCRRLQLHGRTRERLDNPRRARWAEIRGALLRHTPLQYALGETEFYGRSFATDARALIPRPETEILVERALREAALWRKAAPRVVEVGTGSGCVSVSLALERPAARIVAVDVSADALALARENSARHGVAERIEWRRGDLLAGFAPASLDAIVANLPYVRTAEIDRLERSVRDHEPRAALDGGPDGLALLRRLVGQATAALARPGWIFLEIGEDQGAAVRTLLRAAGFDDVVIAPDLEGHDRIAIGRR